MKTKTSKRYLTRNENLLNQRHLRAKIINPMISVIIPVYNAEKYLQRCVECLCAQSCKDCELILVDDGSTDNSLQIAKKYENSSKLHDNHIKVQVIEQENAGPSAARNRGLEVAKGDYVAFIDADDWFDDGLLQAYADAMAEGEWDVIFQSFYRVKADGTAMEMPYAMDADTLSESKEDIVCKLYKKHVFGWSWCKVFKREIIEKYSIRFDENLRLWEDELFTIHFLKHATSIKTLSCRHYRYVQYEGSLMNTNNTYLRRLALRELMNQHLVGLANTELQEYLDDTYNKQLKFSLMMALLNKPDHKCSLVEKRRLLQKYYDRCRQFPELKMYNVLRSKFTYYIAEIALRLFSLTLT